MSIYLLTVMYFSPVTIWSTTYNNKNTHKMTNIQLKRGKQTFIVTISKKHTVLEIKRQLYSIISKVGLRDGDDGDQEGEEEDIYIPKPFNDLHSDSEDESESIQVNNGIKTKIPELDDLIVGKLKDDKDIDSGFKELHDGDVVDLKEFKVFVFRLQNEDFDVKFPVHDD